MASLDLIGLMVMAAIAGVFHVCVGMASLAFKRPLVAVIQREIMDRHTGRRPGLFGMAVLALQPEEAGMDFRLGMAFHTQLRRAMKDLIGMALLAFQIRVDPVEREEIGMVKVAHPVDAVVTIQAGRPELRLVLGHEGRFFVALSVTGDTDVQIELPDVALVAVLAHELVAILFLLMANQAETGGLSVIEGLTVPDGGRPACGGMAVGTVRVKDTLMNLRFRVAIDTSCGCVRKYGLIRLIGDRPGLSSDFGLALVLMALPATQVEVLAIERKIGAGVVEVRHSILPIVTIDAIFAKILHMLTHKRLIGILVTGLALALIEVKFRIDYVAGLTTHGGFIVIHLMPEQTEVGHRMIELAQRRRQRIKVRSLMFGVAAGAFVDI